MIASLKSGIFTAVLLTFLTPCFGQAQSGLAQLSVVCGTESRPGWRQLFAYDGKQWKQFPTLTGISALGEEAARLAQVWQGPMRMTLVSVSASVNESFTQTSYCFQNNGRLKALTHEVRNPSGWTFLSLRQYDASGRAISSTARFFDSTNGRELRSAKKPTGPALLDPNVYSRFEDLPFAKIYRPLTESERY